MRKRKEKFFGGTEKGFTLLELLVAITMLAIICSMIYSALNVSIKFSDQAEKKMLSLTRERGFLSLLNRQIRGAWFDPRKTKVVISAQPDRLRLVTRSPMLYPGAGLVLAFYRYEPADDKIYYTEKLDYYNMDYGDDYLPPLEDMVMLMENSGDIEFNYENRENKVAVSYQGKEYEFIPGCPQ